MRVFWRHGYEASSIAQLRAVTGSSSASFNGAFGSKEGLFERASERYIAGPGRVSELVRDLTLAQDGSRDYRHALRSGTPGRVLLDGVPPAAIQKRGYRSDRHDVGRLNLVVLLQLLILSWCGLWDAAYSAVSTS